MKALYFLFLTLNVVAAVDENLCQLEAKFVGGENNVPAECFEVALPQKEIPALGLEIRSLKQILFIKKTTGEMIRIAGENTGLFHVLSVDVDGVNKEIFVLNKNEHGEVAILSFRMAWQGNVHPLRTISKVHLPQDLKQITFDPKEKRLKALSRDGLRIYRVLPGESSHSDKRQQPVVERLSF